MLIEWSIAGLRAHVAEIAVCGRQWPGVRLLDDRPHAGLGPLAALNAALHYCQDQGFDVVLTTGCDIPQYPSDAVERLIATAPAIIDGQPLIGCWPATLAHRLDDFIASSARRSVYGWADACGAVRIAAVAPILNINTRDDLAAFKASLDC